MGGDIVLVVYVGYGEYIPIFLPTGKLPACYGCATIYAHVISSASIC